VINDKYRFVKFSLVYFTETAAVFYCSVIDSPAYLKAISYQGCLLRLW